MDMDVAEITVAFACANKGMVRERIESVHFDRHGMAHEILSVSPGSIRRGEDQCDSPEYRRVHGLQDASNDASWASIIPTGCTSYVAHVRLRDIGGSVMTRKRVMAIPFGDRDLGFSIDHIGEAG